MRRDARVDLLYFVLCTPKTNSAGTAPSSALPLGAGVPTTGGGHVVVDAVGGMAYQRLLKPSFDTC